MDRIKHLILRFLREEIEPGERAELEEWLASAPENRALLEELQQPALVAEAFVKLDRLRRKEAWERVASHAEAVRGGSAYAGSLHTESKQPAAPELGSDNRRGIRLWRWSAAAVLAGLLGIGAWWLIGTKQGNVVAPVREADVAAPSHNRATLTLADGRRVDRDSAKLGAVAVQGGAKIVKSGNGQLAYGPGLGHNGELLYNTLSNPRGSQVVSLTLTDGSRVWLNAESSIRYPVNFAGSERAVEITGEAYFEVAEDAGKPFRVKKDSTTIEVLGTSFNVNAYADEPAMKVTLLEGKVEVRKEASALVLHPGQQAIITGQVERSGNVDTAAVMAWKNGRFTFNSADLATVLRQLARWYNVEVSYEGKVPNHRFNGRIGRSLTLDQVLDVLGGTGVHYQVQPGQPNRLIIRP
jgi:transmembrane sensor